MEGMYYFVLAIVALALVGDFVICLQHHKKAQNRKVQIDCNDELDEKFYRKNMLFVIVVFVIAAVGLMLAAKVAIVGLMIMIMCIAAIAGIFVQWFIWAMAQDVAKRLS
ncbi:MAG: hypothetical protein E7018_02470 [Alphaproteobacteria bacterium]|nr:hypothetical protein [Alphaproteobacteria bacterium]